MNQRISAGAMLQLAIPGPVAGLIAEEKSRVTLILFSTVGPTRVKCHH